MQHGAERCMVVLYVCVCLCVVCICPAAFHTTLPVTTIISSSNHWRTTFTLLAESFPPFRGHVHVWKLSTRQIYAHTYTPPDPTLRARVKFPVSICQSYHWRACGTRVTSLRLCATGCKTLQIGKQICIIQKPPARVVPFAASELRQWALFHAAKKKHVK